MLETSKNYDPYTDTRKCGIIVTFEMVDIDAAETTTPSVTDECEMSKVYQTHNHTEGMAKKYAMLERDFWKLDGTFVLPQKDLVASEQTGWWSEKISNDEGVFEEHPCLIFEWDSDQSSVGFTLFFDDVANQYPTLFQITAYDENGLIKKRTLVENSSVKCEVNVPIENYRRVEFEMLETSEPNRRVRITEVIFGVIQRFNNSNVVSASVDYEFSPISESLPTSELTLTIDNSDASWNMANPKGVYSYLQQTQPLDVYFQINGESVFMGRYFFATASAEDDSMTAKITAYDKVYWLDSIKYRGGEDGTWTFEQAISTIIASSGLGITYAMSEELAGREVMRSLPKECSCREAICQLAVAARCSVLFDRYANLVFFDPLIEANAVDSLDYDVMATMPKITVGEKINAVELTVKNEYTEKEKVWSVADSTSNEIPQVSEHSNSVTSEGTETATWLLEMLKRRVSYSVTERGNPAREIGDSVIVYDAYGGTRKAVVTKQSFNFDGGLSCDTEVNANG